MIKPIASQPKVVPMDKMNVKFDLPITLGGSFPLFFLLFTALTVVVHVGFAISVARDAGQLQRQQAGPLIAGPLLWTLATLLGGVFVAGLYWVVNHSSLSRR
jgi:hypothetical protein